MLQDLITTNHWYMASEEKINFLSERKYIMIFDDIIRLKESYRLRSNVKSEMNTLDELTGFMFRGDYANVKNKDYILHYWLIYSPKQMARDLNITVKGVYYLKKKINDQLVKELGTDLKNLVYNEKFKTINSRLNSAQKRLTTDSALPAFINNIIKKKITKDSYIKPMDNFLEKNLKATLNGRNDIDIFIPELSFMKIYKKKEICKQIESLNPELLDYLIQLSAGKKGDAELRNLLFNYLNDSQ